MKRFKRFLSLFLVFAMAVSVLPLGTLAADEEDPVEGQVASEEVFGQLSEEAAIETEEEPNQKAKDTVRALTDGVQSSYLSKLQLRPPGLIICTVKLMWI